MDDNSFNLNYKIDIDNNIEYDIDNNIEYVIGISALYLIYYLARNKPLRCG